MPVEDHALVFRPLEAAAHIAAHSPEADHSNLHVLCSW
jgi:hypothetical protein